MSPELRLRIISAIVLVAIALTATWLGGVAFRIFAGIVALLIFYEWSAMSGYPLRERYTLFGWAAVALVVVEFVWRGGQHGYLTSLVLLLGFTVAAAVIVLIRGHRLWLAGGIFYAGLSGIALAALRGDSTGGLITILFIFAIVWSTDILAFFVGRAIRGPKLAPSISPGKTWSGAVGGTVSGIVAGCLVVLFAGETLSIWHAVISAVLSIASQIGDLFESSMKRRFGVKDSSGLIPGHGGVMDRVDGLVFACFLAFLGALALSAVSGRLASAPGEIISGG